MKGLAQVSKWLMLVDLQLNNHISVAGVTLEQPVHPGNDLCPAGEGTGCSYPCTGRVC